MAALLPPTPRTTPDEWGAANRTYPASAGRPGNRNPGLTPYMIPFERAAAEGTHKRVVMAMFAQGGKSEALLDIIGQRLDQFPTPILYVGPNKQFITEQWEPRVMALLDEAPTLRSKLARGKRMSKTRKLISGVPLRLAHAGSSTALKSDPMGLALTDEADELMASVKGQGDPIGLIDARGETYADFVHAIVSTPSRGPKETVVDETTGLEFWAEQDANNIESKIWALWQNGTRYHWTWKCPACSERFIPRFSCLDIPKNATPSEARTKTRLICPRHGCVIDSDAQTLNETGLYVGPGQDIVDDVVVGDPPDSTTVSFWVSGLCSPFTSFGERAEAYVTALRSGDQQAVQVVVNAGFGELWAPIGGDVPEWEEVRKRSLPYARGELPDGVLFLTCGVDVQGNRLVYVVRGWGERQESWLISEGEVWGDTSLDDPWIELAEDVLGAEYGGLPIIRTFVDAGFRPGKKVMVPEHKVYEFARRHARTVWATKGYDHRPSPLSVNTIDVTPKGSRAKVGLELVRLSSDFMKGWVHERIRWPVDMPGAWHLHGEVTEEYCRQIVSEARVRKPSGGFTWIARYRDNHFLDAEALCFAAAYMVGVQKPQVMERFRLYRERTADASPARPKTTQRPAEDAPVAPLPRKASGEWLTGGAPRKGGWLG